MSREQRALTPILMSLIPYTISLIPRKIKAMSIKQVRFLSVIYTLFIQTMHKNRTDINFEYIHGELPATRIAGRTQSKHFIIVPDRVSMYIIFPVEEVPYIFCYTRTVNHVTRLLW